LEAVTGVQTCALPISINDADVASIINYLRKNFAPPGTPEVTPAQVAAQRAKP
jgi:hypothetical protein